MEVLKYKYHKIILRFQYFSFLKPTVQNLKTLNLLSYMTNKNSK